MTRAADSTREHAAHRRALPRTDERATGPEAPTVPPDVAVCSPAKLQEDGRYLAAALESRRARGLPDKIKDPNVWRNFVRALRR